jgi:hypothetical protein
MRQDPPTGVPVAQLVQAPLESQLVQRGPQQVPLMHDALAQSMSAAHGPPRTATQPPLAERVHPAAQLVHKFACNGHAAQFGSSQ